MRVKRRDATLLTHSFPCLISLRRLVTLPKGLLLIAFWTTAATETPVWSNFLLRCCAGNCAKAFSIKICSVHESFSTRFSKTPMRIGSSHQPTSHESKIYLLMPTPTSPMTHHRRVYPACLGRAGRCEQQLSQTNDNNFEVSGNRNYTNHCCVSAAITWLFAVMLLLQL